MDKSTGQFYCFGCQESRDFVQLIMFCSKRTYFEAMRIIGSKKSEISIASEVGRLLENKEEMPEFDMDTVSRLNAAALGSPRAAEYLKGRLITKQSVEKYLIGYSEKQDMITIPVFSPDNVCVGMVGRSIEGKQFKNTSNLPRNKTFFNLSRNKVADKIFLVESSFDAIRLEQCGGRAIASLGSSVSRFQRDLLKKYFTSIILVSDNDDAGKAMKEKLFNSLGRMLIVAKLPEDVKDVSDLDDNTLYKFIQQFDNEIEYILTNI